jgi:uncharacterized protein (DUF2252 family)
MQDARSIILAFNKSLSPQWQEIKYKAMQQSAFRFYRGSCHLFYDRLAALGLPKDHTQAWICGDLHLENFGSFKGDNGLVYFDLNDFDEAALAPLSMEVLRFATAILIAADLFKYSNKQAKELTLAALKLYSDTMIQSKSLMIERESATGLIKDFLDQVSQRKREALIKSVTKVSGKKHRFTIDNLHRFKMDKEPHEHLMSWLDKELSDIGKLKGMDVQDCIRRVAGTGSIGVDRYAILVGNKKGKSYMLDMKEAKPSSLSKHLSIKQPHWGNEAGRVTTVQKRLQYCSPALLRPVYYNKKWYVLKALQPIQDKVDLAAAQGKLDKLEEIINPMARLAAYAHLRGTGRQGSSTADELADQVSRSKWVQHRFDLAQALAHQARQDYKDFMKYKIGP